MNKTALMPRSTLIFSTLLSLLLISLQQMQPLLIYERESILAGEAWRIVSGNLVHTNDYHLYINLAGFWIFLLLCGSVVRLKLLIFSIFLGSSLIGLTLLALHPEIAWYAGFSGVLYGLFITGALCLVFAGEIWAFLALMLLIIFKLISIFLGDSDDLTQNLINAPILSESHIYGAIAGLITGITCFSRSLRMNNN